MSRAQQITEAVDSMMLKSPILRDQFTKERTKFRHQSSKTPLSHMTRVSRELVDAGGFDASQNPWNRPTIGRDAEATYFDPNPISRWAPAFKRVLTKNMKESLTEAKGGSKAAFFAKKKKRAPQQQQEEPDSGQDDVQQQDQEQGDNQKQFAQQQTQMLQAQGLPPNQTSPQDAMQGQPNQGGMQQPQLPELPGDITKDPSWEGNRSAQISNKLKTFSQKIGDRYSMNGDPFLENPGPRTFSRRMRQNQIEQIKFGDKQTRQLRNNRSAGQEGGGT